MCCSNFLNNYDDLSVLITFLAFRVDACFSPVIFSAVFFFSESSSEPNGLLMQKNNHTAGTVQSPKHMILLDAQSSKKCVFSLVVTVNFNYLNKDIREKHNIS